MSESYFQRVAESTPTRLWVNNPTGQEIDLALSQGAVGSTTNPSYAGGLLRREPDYVREVIREVVMSGVDEDDAFLAEAVQQKLVKRITDRFCAVYDETGGRAGYVSLQGSPYSDNDAGEILREAQDARKVAPNVAPKLPATEPGLDAFETLVADGSPCIVTEVFSVAQLIDTCERYLRTTRTTGVTPPFFMSPITGILGDHLRKIAARDGTEVSPAALRLAGVALARRCHAVVTARQYPVTLLFGGARSTDDFTGLVGGPTAATINYSTVLEILALSPPVEATIDRPVPTDVLEELLGKFPDFQRGWAETGLSPAEFEGFGPVQHFRDTFVAAWDSLLMTIREARAGARAR